MQSANSKKKIARRRFLKQGSLTAAVAASRLTTSKALSETDHQTDMAQPQYRGPLSDFNSNDREFDSLQFSLSTYERIEPSLGFSSKDKRSARVWQKQVRSKLIELVGSFPRNRCALRPEILERKTLSGYVREKIVFESRDGLSVFGYLLLPNNRELPVPAVVCLPGHGRGADDIVGIAEDGKLRQTKSGYAKDFALQTVEKGYAAFAIEQMAFGCRRDEAARRKGSAQSSCQPAAGAALLFGQTMIGWRVWDVCRAIDYLTTRPEVDPRRIATMGISGGGTISYFAAALDERVQMAVVSGYFNTFRDSILSRSHCIDNYIPGILNYVEMYDIAGLIAPRRLFVESATRDPIFPVEASKRAFDKARHIYAVFGVPENVGQEVFDGDHEFHGKGAFEFLKKWL
ncbi:MAG TPA: alpha/beta hydrolase family protein [Blastocatellia bacterium]|nr:alpha/beta hydrolase family protein [Blastocatellia bacterium]